GYCVASHRFDTGALILLAIFTLWQIPHSHAIALFRFDDYRAAALPVLPVRRGVAAARKHILLSITAFTAVALLLSFCGYTGTNFLAAAATLGLTWLLLALTGNRADKQRLWARRLFVFSILGIITLSVMMALDAKIPASPPKMDGRPHLAAVRR
ncbi:MAG: UbiA family prenyltransferase, partial [Deltaproteobacteria bacterium]